VLDALTNGFVTFVQLHPWLSTWVSIGYFIYRAFGRIYRTFGPIEPAFDKFVTFTHKMRLHWRRLRAEPDSRLVTQRRAGRSRSRSGVRNSARRSETPTRDGLILTIGDGDGREVAADRRG
jgi:hypothetical protein